MKMTAVEKLFVNRPGHAAQVALRAGKLLERCQFQPGQRYLDVGCGIGSAARKIAETRALDVTGIDIDPEQIKAAESGPARLNLRFFTMDTGRLQFPDAQFDIVATSKALHHIPERARAFREMARVLRDGGYLIFTDFVLPAWFPSARLPSERNLDELATKAGLTRIYRSRHFLAVDLIWQKESKPNSGRQRE